MTPANTCLSHVPVPALAAGGMLGGQGLWGQEEQEPHVPSRSLVS